MVLDLSIGITERQQPVAKLRVALEDILCLLAELPGKARSGQCGFGTEELLAGGERRVLEPADVQLVVRNPIVTAGVAAPERGGIWSIQARSYAHLSHEPVEGSVRIACPHARILIGVG